MKKLIWNIAKRFLVILPIVALFLYMYDQLVILEQRNAREKIISEHSAHLQLMEYMVGTVFDEYYATIHLIRNSNEMSYYLEDPSERTQEEVVSFFKRMSVNRPYIKGLLLGNAEGEPLFGLTHFGEDPEPFDEDAPYQDIWHLLAPQAENLDEQAVQFSPFIHRREDTDPDGWVHLIGFAIPVRLHGELVGIIGMLVDGEHILASLRQFLTSHPGEIRYGLADSHGRWVMRFDQGSILSFEPDDPPVVESLPRLWDMVLASGDGELSIDGVNYHFRAFDPLAQESEFYRTYRHFLVGLMSFSDADVIVLEDSFLLRNKPLRWILALLLLLLGGFINLLAYFRRNDRELLAVSNLVSDQSNDGVVITDTMQHVTYCNKTFELMSGYANEELIDRKHEVRSLSGDPFDSSAVIREARPKDLASTSWQGFVWVLGKKHVALSHLSVSTIVNTHGYLLHDVYLYSDPRNLSRESYRTMVTAPGMAASDTDGYPLQLVEMMRTSGRHFVLVYLKLINLDMIEAQYSLDEHYALGSAIRERLIGAIDGGLMIQYSPDTYLLAVPVESKTDHAGVSRLDAAFEEPFGSRENAQLLRVRMGVSRVSEESEDSAMMLRQSRMAFAALDHYERNGFLVYDESVNEQLKRYYLILQAFPEAVAKKELNVFFQPVVSVADGTVRAAEALVRWNHPQLGPLSPAEFIPIVEQNRLERMLGTYVVDHVVRFLRRIKDEAGKDISLSLNLCPTELQDPDLVSHMVRTLDHLGVAHDRLLIELTERTLLTDMDAANSVLEQLRNEHILVAIDDFGTGFSSLSYLHELDVDLLKIDRSFIKNYPDEDDGIILKAMIGMARELAIPVLVEGIETPGQLAFLKQLGVSSYQGFLFSKAIDADAFIKLLNS